jgi:drug/metabolite transporter (DMT)-like permease
MAYIGEIAALVTSICWSFSAIGFTKATEKVGPQTTNRMRVLLALLVLLAINAVLYHQPVPLHAGGPRWAWLSISGIIGLSLGDSFLFLAYQEIGPRLGLLLLSMAPIASAGIAWIFFAQTLSGLQITGILVTLGGIAWVILIRPAEQDGRTRTITRRGILFGALAALAQAVGLVLSQQGMAGSFSPFVGDLIRMLAASAGLWIAACFQRQVGDSVNRMRACPGAFGWTAFGALFGPVIGVSASLLAVQHTGVGVASTLMALPPVFMLPISYFVFKERFAWQAVAGTLIAMAGVTLLFLS